MRLLKNVLLALILATVLILGGLLLTGDVPTVVNDVEVQALGHMHTPNCGHLQAI